jgi:hypothetical protein
MGTGMGAILMFIILSYTNRDTPGHARSPDHLGFMSARSHTSNSPS